MSLINNNATIYYISTIYPFFEILAQVVIDEVLLGW